MKAFSISNIIFLSVFASIGWSVNSDKHIDSSQVNRIAIDFLDKGWVTFKNLIPDLRNSVVQNQIMTTYAATQLNFLVFSKEWLVTELGYNCDDKADICGNFDINDYDPLKVAPLNAKKQYENGFKILKCCIFEFNKDKRKGLVKKTATFPYYQALNPHRMNPFIYTLIMESMFPTMASWLLQTPRVRLYQTALFQKSNKTINDGTSWHQDLNMVPLDTGYDGYVTFWCPLYNISVTNGDSSLIFAERSHRDKSHTQWYSENAGVTPPVIKSRFTLAYEDELLVGDCTAHHGWTYHSASAQPENNRERLSIGFSFVADTARVLIDLSGKQQRYFRPFGMEDELSFSPWINDLKPMTNINHALLPLVYNYGKAIDYSKEYNTGYRLLYAKMVSALPSSSLNETVVSYIYDNLSTQEIPLPPSASFKSDRGDLDLSLFYSEYENVKKIYYMLMGKTNPKLQEKQQSSSKQPLEPSSLLSQQNKKNFNHKPEVVTTNNNINDYSSSNSKGQFGISVSDISKEGKSQYAVLDEYVSGEGSELGKGQRGMARTGLSDTAWGSSYDSDVSDDMVVGTGSEQVSIRKKKLMRRKAKK